MVALLDECRRSDFKGIAGCDITYLILVCLFNYHDRHESNPAVSDLFERFRHLGYNNDRVRRALFDLWSLRNEEFGHVLSIFQKELPRSARDIRDDAEVELNYRGDRLIKKVSVSFTFINRLLYDKDDDYFYPRRAKAAIRHYYEIRYIAEHTKWTCKFLYGLGFLHSLELHKIRTRYGAADWYNRYAHDFCIDRDLQLQRIIDSHIHFLEKAVQQHGRQEGDAWKRGVLNGIEWLFCLSKLYDMQVKDLRHDNARDKWVLDFDRVLVDIWDKRLDAAHPELIYAADYRKNIAEML